MLIAAIGNPNTGKSTVFNALTGLNQKVANYPGVTVERHAGRMQLASGQVELIDLPGTYSLAAQSPDEMVAVDVLLGRIADAGQPQAVLLVVDASNLRRNLYLATQVLELGLPAVIALNMSDVAERRGIAIDAAGLAEALQCRIVPIVAVRGTGMGALRAALDAALKDPQRPRAPLLPEVRDAAGSIARELAEHGAPMAPYAIERALIDKGGYAEQRLCQTAGENWRERLQTLRARLSPEQPLAMLESRRRYALINHL
ncbi:MAG: FeoB small GTPase domain-containing protein, partial [Pseudomonadota bacterium]